MTAMDRELPLADACSRPIAVNPNPGAHGGHSLLNCRARRAQQLVLVEFDCTRNQNLFMSMLQ